MSLVDFGTHAELEQRRCYTDPSGCTGRMLVVAQGDIWEIECERCGFPAALHSREVNPLAYNDQLLERRRRSSGLPDGLRGLALPDCGTTGAVAAARQWAAAQLSGLVLTGPVGV